MGHEVIHCHFPGNVMGRTQIPELYSIRANAPTIEQMNSCHAVISFYHEYTQQWLDLVYGFQEWSKLKTPVIAQFNESFCRNDLGLPERWTELRSWAQHFYFPAAQDAERFGGHWMPYGIDTTMFKKTSAPKKYNVGFIGSLYDSRRTYLQKLATLAPNDLIFNCGSVSVQDLSGILPFESTQLLAENYRHIKIFFCLPPISRLIVEKVFEIMACGTFVMYPKLPGETAKNLSVFQDGKEIVYYENGVLSDNIRQICHYVKHEDEREKIAQAGHDKVHRDHRLDSMLETMFSVL